MSRLLQRETDKLKKQILTLGMKVEENVHAVVKAVNCRSAELAVRVISSDPHIDQIEVDLEEECLKILALYQPVAIDLRFIIAVLKINNDLERIGDLTVNIAERGEFLSRQKQIDIPFDFLGMAEKVQAMLRESLDSLVNMDADLAYRVCAADDEVDAINREMYRQVGKEMRKNPGRIDCLIHLLGISRDLERIADYATNIAEDVIYMIQGDIVRHQAEKYAVKRKANSHS